jgi:3D (Asp-Asp-Asp) domain-containing protein
MTKIENGRDLRRLTREARLLIIAGLIMAALLVAGILQTALSFTPRANDLRAQQAAMQSELDAMQEDLTRISEEVESWPGIVVIPDETVGTLWQPEAPVTATSEAEWVTYKVTAYCPCARCCGKSDGVTASGKIAEEGRTVAADWSVLPNGTVIEIEGVGIRTVEDNGGFRGKQLDLFFSAHEEALRWTDPNGHHDLKVRVVSWP